MFLNDGIFATYNPGTVTNMSWMFDGEEFEIVQISVVASRDTYDEFYPSDHPARTEWEQM